MTHEELKRLFERHGFFTTNKEVSQLMDRFDKNKDGRISYAEFMDEVVPKSPQKF